MIIKTYKKRIYPNKKQQILINKNFGAVRWIYNWALDKRIKAYQKNKKRISCFDLIKELPKLKKQKETEWLKEANAQSLQQAIRNLDNAFTRFFREKKGFPKFKSKKRNKNNYKTTQGTKIDFESKKLQIELLLLVKIISISILQV
jgi:putative transposase